MYKGIFLIVVIVLIHFSCQSQQSDTKFKYSKIDFGLDTPSIGITDRDPYWKGGDPFLKRNDYLNRYYFPKNSKQWKNYVDTVYHVKLIDTITKLLLNKELLLKNFEVYAFWVDGKYVSKMKEGAEDGTMVDFYYLEDDVVIPYTLYKLTDKGWFWLEDGKKKIDYPQSFFIPYLKPETIPVSFPKEWLEEVNQKN